MELKRIKTAALIVVFMAICVRSQANEGKDTTRIGIFFQSIYNLDFANYSYNTNFWMWSVVRGDIDGNGKIDEDDSLASLERINSIELSNAKDYSYSRQTSTRVEKEGKTYWWASQFCKADIYQKWNLENYPFDKQRLLLKFESSAYDTSQVIMTHEQDSLTFKRDINLIGWDIMRSKIGGRVITYKTDFGDPNGNGKSAYSRVIYIIELKRQAAAAFFVKLCLGAFIAFMVSLIVFFISPSSMDSRFGLGIGALFAVVANKYVVDSNIPATATNCLVDKIHEITFVYILLALISTIISQRIHEKYGETDKKRMWFDIIAFSALLLSYVIVIVFIWTHAHQVIDMRIGGGGGTGTGN